MLVLGVVRGEDVADGFGVSVVEVRGGAPDFAQRGRVEGAFLVVVGSCADVVKLEVGVVFAGVADAALGAIEEFPAFFQEFSALLGVERGEVGAFEGAHVFEIGVHVQGDVFGLDRHEDVGDALADGELGAGTDAGYHAGRGDVREEEALGVLGVAEAVVHLVPVESVGASVGVAGGAAVPALEAKGGVVEGDFAAADGVGGGFGAEGDGGRVQGAGGRGGGVGGAGSVFFQKCGVAVADEDVPAVGLQGNGAAALQGDAFFERGREGERGGELVGVCVVPVVAFADEVVVEPLVEGGDLKREQLVGAGERDVELVIGAEGEGGGICGAVVHVVEKHGGEDAALGVVYDAEGVGVGPAAVELCERESVLRDDVHGVEAFAVGGFDKPEDGLRAIGQGDVGAEGVRGDVHEGDLGGDFEAVRGLVGEEVCDGQRFAIPGDEEGAWLPDRGDCEDDLVLGKVYDADGVAEPVGDVEVFAAGAEGEALGGVPDGDGGLGFFARQGDDFDGAPGTPAGGIERGAIRGEEDVVGVLGEGDAFRGGGVGERAYGDGPGGCQRGVNDAPVLVHGHGAGCEVGGGAGGERAEEEDAEEEDAEEAGKKDWV